MSEKLNVVRKKYAVLRNDGTVLVGWPHNFRFEDMGHVGVLPIKTYSSEKKALVGHTGAEYRIVPVMESVFEV